mmetsp:Transcript_9821/g.19423  ORF Transcript_9821/g.19423 Transcript_9821/m.19423 type:complete len:228 (+) Transcript_9821:354-1037(+)
MERRPIHTTVMPLQHILDNSIPASKQFCIRLCRPHRQLVTRTHTWGHILLPQRANIPHTHSLIQRGRNHQILLWVELSTHHVVIMPRQHSRTRPRLPIPNTYRLIIRCTHNPRRLAVKLHRANVIQMPQKRKQAPSLLIVPHLDLVIISSRHKQRLRWMKIHSSNRPFMLIEAINQRPHPVVPQLNHPAVKRGQYPWPLRMETESLHSITLCFKFSQHIPLNITTLI